MRTSMKSAVCSGDRSIPRNEPAAAARWLLGGLTLLALLAVSGCEDPQVTSPAPGAKQPAASSGSPSSAASPSSSAQAAAPAGGQAASRPAAQPQRAGAGQAEAPRPPGFAAQRKEPLKAGQARKGAATLALTSEEAQPVAPQVGSLTHQSLIVRELIRQAVLVAGREGLGLSTRDGTLREPLTAAGDAGAGEGEAAAAAGEAVPMDVHWYVVADREAWFAVADHDPAEEARGGEPGRGANSGPPLTFKPWFERSMPLRDTKRPEFARVPEVLEQAEALSRGELVAALKSAGFAAGKATAPAAAGAAPPPTPAIAEALDRLDLFSQFQAVRLAHGELRDKGESPARLGALARGYANLGQLAQFHWSGGHNAFAARSLLYAQRMLAAAGDDAPAAAVALWHRAYAYALAGMHGEALKDMAEAAKRRTAAGDKKKPPAFVELIDPYCRYQSGKLGKLAVADPRRAPLAMFLCFLTLENSYAVGMPIEVGKAALQVDAGSARVIDSMCDRAGVAYLHQLTDMAPKVFASLMLARLKPLKTVPEAVRAAGRNNWNTPATQAAVAKAMVEAGAPGKDAAEPSWAVLGRQVQETHFAQVRRRAFFMARQWGVETGRYAREVEPLVADHPYHTWFRAVAHGIDRVDPTELARIQVTDAEGRGYEMVERVTRVRYKVVPKYSGDIQVHTNPSAWHLERRLVGRKDSTLATLLEVSPHSPAAIADLITHAWDENQDKVKAWEEGSDAHPTVMAAFARRHTEAGRPAEAERFLKRFIERSPDYWAYLMLAQNYLLTGKEDQFVATLESFLEKEDYGLTHGEARVRIARHFMAKGDYARAEPYVLAANETGAAFAMTAAADLYEGKGDLDQAERWMRQMMERYGGDVQTWHRWCLRTGRGDLAAAERDARAEADARAASAEPQARGQAGVFQLVMGNPEAARPLFEKAREYPVSALHLAMLCQAADDYGARDQAVQFAAMNAEPGMQRHPDLKELSQVAALMRDAWKEGPLATLDPEKVERIVAHASPRARTTIDYFVGRFFDLQDSPDDAVKYFTRCIRGERNLATAMLAWLELKRRGIDPKTLIAPGAGAKAAPAPAAK